MIFVLEDFEKSFRGQSDGPIKNGVIATLFDKRKHLTYRIVT